MAEIVRKGRQLEEEYLAIERQRTEAKRRGLRAFGKTALALAAVYAAILATVSAAGLFSTAFVPLTAVFAVALIVSFTACTYTSPPDTSRAEVLAAGIEGERAAAEVLSRLPDDYTVFQDVTVAFDGGVSEIDNIVIGRSGVFVVETKHHNGDIRGDFDDEQWTQHKVGRGGTPYSRELHSPVRQIRTHIYRLANYLRENGINTYVEGLVLFTNPECALRISGVTSVSVYAVSAGGADAIVARILSEGYRLDSRNVRRACELIDSL